MNPSQPPVLLNTLTTAHRPRTLHAHGLGGGARQCCLILDGDLYRDRVGAPAIVHHLLESAAIPPTAFVYLSAGDGAARHRDFTCSDTFTDFLQHHVIEGIKEQVGPFDRFYLCGLSLSGLAAAYAVHRLPKIFSGCIAQSPSAWWNNEWLTAAIDSAANGRFWLSVGDQERQTDVRHPPTGLHQAVSQWDSVHRLSARLQSAGADVHLKTFTGGHDPACWANELPAALSWLLVDRD